MKIAAITPDRKRDYLAEMVLEGLMTLGHEVIVSDPGNGVSDSRLSDDEFASAADGADACLIFFGKVRGNSPPRRELAWRLGLPKSRIVYLDGAEWAANGWDSGDQARAALADPSRRRGEPWIDEEMFLRCGVYFKRECYPQDLERGVVPLPFAMCRRHIQDAVPKDIDVLCSFGHTKTGLRQEAIDVVEHFRRTMDPSSGLNIVVRSGMNVDDYREAIARSRIVIDAFGGGDTTDRFWEAVGARACVLYQRYNVVMPRPFVDWQHAVSWSSKGELSNHLHRLVYGSEAEDIGIEGHDHALRYHRASDRATQVVQLALMSRHPSRPTRGT